MRISDQPPVMLGTERTNQPDKKPAGKDTNRAAVSVQIGPDAARADSATGRLEKAILQRLETTRAQIRDGSYPINFDRLSELIVDDELMRSGG